MILWSYFGNKIELRKTASPSNDEVPL